MNKNVNADVLNNLVESVKYVERLTMVLDLFYDGLISGDTLLKVEEAAAKVINKNGYSLFTIFEGAQKDLEFLPTGYNITNSINGVYNNSLIQGKIKDACENSRSKLSINGYIDQKGVQLDLVKYIYRTSSYNKGARGIYKDRPVEVTGYYLGDKKFGYPLRYKLMYTDTNTLTDGYVCNVTI